MSIYLIRHTEPKIEKGFCYGQADIDITESFLSESAIIRDHIPADVKKVFSSPLIRCRKLAEHLFPSHSISFEPDLRELHCGEWELRAWDDIPRHEIDPWMKDFVNVVIPKGESYQQLFRRVVNCFEKVAASGKPVVVVTHGGVIRSILAHITSTPLIDSFNKFKLHYGCVVKISSLESANCYEMLSNIAGGKEQHKPGYF